MDDMADFALGLIEGFYGRQWSWDERKGMADFLGQQGYSHYIYAPKGDRNLRSAWREPCGAEWLTALKSFGEHCHRANLQWGLGFSPMGLHERYAAADREVLLRTLDQLNSLSPDVLWLLFDDMRGDHENLARNQCAVAADVKAVFAGALAVCPSYYSSDPVLDQVFGQRPPNYLEELGQTLPADTNILWTGAKVISHTLGESDCLDFQTATGRKPLLWDNYPVNDGRKTSRFLHLNAFTGRSPKLRDCAAGHFVNPMNQAELSKIALASLPQLYSDHRFDSDSSRVEAIDRLPAELSRLLHRDWKLFQERGLDAIDAAQKADLRTEYGRWQHPAAREVSDWLADQYRFDPDCLTE